MNDCFQVVDPMARSISGMLGMLHFLNKIIQAILKLIYFRTEKELAGMDDAHEGMIWDMSWHPLGHMLVSGSNDHTTFVFICLL